METMDLNKSDFAAIAKQNDNETRQLVIEGGVWYEQITVDDVAYRHKLLSVRAVTKEALDRKAQEILPGALPIRLKENSQGEVLAFVCKGKATLFYHVPLGTKQWKAHAQRVVFNYAKSLLAKEA